ncbi:MAG: acetyl-CoA acetyltransferase [Gammaproteobacteria bacterium]|jgi:acetyl-CoA acyltransferase|nr:acetyl-CoA acetyltransferase [Gammaproteobacteria bacterium]
MTNQAVYIVSALRTPVGKANRGIFRLTRPDDLAAHVIKGVMDHTPGVNPRDVEDVIMGCAMPEAEQGMNVARIAALLAGLPDSVPGMTINRFCSSGVQSIALAADRIALGQADVMIAGGVESMSMVPMGGNKLSANPKFFSENELVGIAYGMGITAEKVAEKWQVSRADQDQFALASHQKALNAIQSGWFKNEILPYTVTSRAPDLDNFKINLNESIADTDEGPRADTSLEALNKLKPAFDKTGSVTAGNSSQVSDGAAAVLLVSERYLIQHRLKPLARFCGFSVAGVPPDIMGIGPIMAIPKVLKQTGLTLEQLDWIELNEAFAAQSLAVIRELKLDKSKVNPEGGAIALGHPLGATGAILTAKLIHGLHRTNGRYGLVTMCIGTGMGAAAIFEKC